MLNSKLIASYPSHLNECKEGNIYILLAGQDEEIIFNLVRGYFFNSTVIGPSNRNHPVVTTW